MGTQLQPVRLAANFKFTRKMRNEDTANTWWDFNNTFTNIEIKSPDDLSGIVERGHSICSQHRHIHHPKTRGDGTQGQYAFRYHLNWMPTSVAILDFDSGHVDPKGIFDNEFVAAHGWMTYTTTSHTPEHPRFRLVFALPRPVQTLENYSDLLAALAWRFNTADRASKNPVQPFAGNSGANYDRVLHGQWLTVTAAVELIREHKDSIAEQAKSRSYLDDAELEIGVAEIREMLRFIPTRMDYTEWCRILFSVRNSVSSVELAVDLCEEWSPGTPGEIFYKLNNLTLGRTGIGHLIKMAQQYGYETPQKREQKTAQFMRNALRGNRRH